MTSSFQDEKIYLRMFSDADAPVLERYLNHPEMSGRRYIPWRFPGIAPLSSKHVEAILKEWSESEKGFCLAVVTQAHQEVVGHIQADWGWDAHSPHVSVAIAPEHQKQGFGTRALTLVLRYLFEETPAHNLGADWVAEWNQPALNFLNKNGFAQCGTARWVGMHAGRPFNMIVHDLLRREWLARQGRPHASGK